MDAATDDAPAGPPEGAPHAQPRVPRRRWALRGLVVLVLAGGAAAIGVATVSIVSDARDSGTARRTTFGVLMPDATQYRALVSDLLDRKHPKRLRGLTVVGAKGKVTVLNARADRPSFPSSYLNPGALSLIARAVGAHSNAPVTVEQLRLEQPRRTGRLRWRLRGTKAGRPWRATIAPNGTNLQRLPVGGS